MLMEPMNLSFGALIAYLNRAIVQMEDPRQVSNGRKYSLKDVVLAAFSVFFRQSESFLDYQRHLESHHGNSNAQSLFGMIRVPTVPQIRNIQGRDSSHCFIRGVPLGVSSSEAAGSLESV
jgi:hypothetical protein